MHSALRHVFAAAIFVAGGMQLCLASDTVEFSADAVQSAPQRQPVLARLYVGKAGMRMERDAGGQQIVEIVLPAQQRQIILFPQKRQYMEQQVPAGAAPGPSMGSGDTNPCTGLRDVSCKALGTEKINGRDAHKWEMSGSRDGQTVRTLTWIDVERNMPVRQFFSDGTVSELKVVGHEVVNGRQTEKWALTVRQTDGKSTTSYQWYDPQLKLAIRDEMDGGYIRELRNVKVAPQPPSLFTIPSGYRKTTPPAR